MRLWKNSGRQRRNRLVGGRKQREYRSLLVTGDQPRIDDRFVELQGESDQRAFNRAQASCILDAPWLKVGVGGKGQFGIRSLESREFKDLDRVLR